MLFAQQAGGPAPNALAGLGIALAIGVCLFLIVALVVAIFFLMTLMNALKKCDPRNRTMEPWQVWLNFVPCFNIVWQFVTVNRVADSLSNEFRSRGVRRETDYGRMLGLAAILTGIVANVVERAGNTGGNQQVVLATAGVSLLFSVASLVLFIMYWVRIAGYSRELSEGVADGYEDEYDDRDRDDDEPRGRRDNYRRDRDDDPGFDFRDRSDR